MSKALSKKGSGFATVKEMLKKSKPKLQAALSGMLTPDKFISVAMTALLNNPALLECTQISLISSIIQAAQYNLSLDPVLGQAYLVPFVVKGVKRCQFIPGYRGLIALANNAESVKAVSTAVVWDNEAFKIVKGLNPVLDHTPLPPEERGENIIGAYALIKLTSGEQVFDFMYTSEINKVRDGAPSAKASFSPWKNHWEEMAKKTVLRRLLKLVPMSTERGNQMMLRAANQDEMFDAGLTTIEIDSVEQFEAQQAEEQTAMNQQKTSNLAEKMAEKNLFNNDVSQEEEEKAACMKELQKQMALRFKTGIESAKFISSICNGKSRVSDLSLDELVQCISAIDKVKKLK